VKRVVYSAAAAKNLRTYRNVSARVMKAISEYASDPHAHANAVTKLVGSQAKRLRVGDFRVIFEETADTLTVTKIGPRGSVYE
jgi:mRNA interferase RelE/StbE